MLWMIRDSANQSSKKSQTKIANRTAIIWTKTHKMIPKNKRKTPFIRKNLVISKQSSKIRINNFVAKNQITSATKTKNKWSNVMRKNAKRKALKITQTNSLAKKRKRNNVTQSIIRKVWWGIWGNGFKRTEKILERNGKYSLEIKGTIGKRSQTSLSTTQWTAIIKIEKKDNTKMQYE